MRKRSLFVLALVMVMVVLISGCGGTNKPVVEEKATNVHVIIDKMSEVPRVYICQTGALTFYSGSVEFKNNEIFYRFQGNCIVLQFVPVNEVDTNIKFVLGDKPFEIAFDSR